MSETAGKKLLLVGNPNVGKSALFTRITGVHAVSSNYPGTTVGFLEGWLRRGDDVWRVVDVPGAYTLTPTNEAEEVAEAIRMYNEARFGNRPLERSQLKQALRLIRPSRVAR